MQYQGPGQGQGQSSLYDKNYDSNLNSSRSFSDAQSTIKQQIYQIKLLTSDNQIKTQQLDIVKEKVKELEDSASIYKKQIANLEGKLKLYDQELKLKLQTTEEKSIKMNQNNQYLYKKAQQLQSRVKELEEKNKGSEQEFIRSASEVESMRRKLADMGEQLERSKEKRKRKEEEVERLMESQKQLSSENNDLNYSIQQLNQENERLSRQIEDNDIQIRKLTAIQQQYHEMKISYDNEFAESRALKQSYDLLKQKYDDVYYNYNLVLVNKQEEEAENEENKMKIIDLEQELKHLQTVLSQKDKETLRLNEETRDLHHHLKETDIQFETEIKRIVNLIDGQTTSFDYETSGDSVATRLLIENIIRQNREMVRLGERYKGLSQDSKELKMNLTRLTDEKNSLKNANEEAAKENELLRNRLQATIAESVQSVNLAQSSFEERMQEMANRQREMEAQFNEQLQQKESEILYFQELLNNTKDKLHKVEEDRDGAIEFLREQEAEIKEFKAKFFHIAEETNIQKNRLNITAYVITSMLKVLFNLLSKFENLVQQKAFLVPYFNQYGKIKEKLISMQLTSPSIRGDNSAIYDRFRRVVLTVVAAIRLRKLQLKHGGARFDSFDVRHNLENHPEGYKRFIIDLFRSNKFIVSRELVSAVEDALKSSDNESETGIATKAIVAGIRHNGFPYEPDTMLRRRRTKEVQLDDLAANFRIKEDFHTRLQALDGKLQAAEEYIFKQEEKFAGELNNLSEKLREARSQSENYQKEHERTQLDFAAVKEHIDTLLSVIDEKQTAVPETERRSRNIQEDFNILQNGVLSLIKKFDIKRKEFEEKELRLIELERQVLQLSNDEVNSSMLRSAPNFNVPRTAQKVAGKIVSSGRKRGYNDI